MNRSITQPRNKGYILIWTVVMLAFVSSWMVGKDLWYAKQNGAESLPVLIKRLFKGAQDMRSIDLIAIHVSKKIQRQMRRLNGFNKFQYGLYWYCHFKPTPECPAALIASRRTVDLSLLELMSTLLTTAPELCRQNNMEPCDAKLILGYGDNKLLVPVVLPTQIFQNVFDLIKYLEPQPYILKNGFYLVVTTRGYPKLMSLPLTFGLNLLGREIRYQEQHYGVIHFEYANKTTYVREPSLAFNTILTSPVEFMGIPE